MNLFNEIQDDLKILKSKISELKKVGFQKAEAEERYRIALAKFMAEKILSGEKVSVLGDLARGQQDVARLRLNRDKYQIIYDSIQEGIFALKTQIRISETMLKLEWGKKE